MKSKIVILSFVACIVCTTANAQLYEMESSRNMDLSTKSSRMEKVFFTIDSSRMSLKAGERTYYYDATSFNLDDNGVITMKALDLNDETVTIKFSPMDKMLDYYLHEARIRYFLDNVTMPEPEEVVDSATAMSDTMSEEDKEAKAEAEAMKKDTMIYNTADVMPEYPEGKQAMLTYFQKNVKYPSQAKKEGLKGFVSVDVIIEKDGTIKYAKVKKDIGGGCGNEAVRVVKAMPGWTPGEKNGEAVRVRVPVTVSFMPK